jgi:hypothetical protein
MDEQSGEILDSISVPVASGFQSVPDVHAASCGASARKPEGISATSREDRASDIQGPENR